MKKILFWITIIGLAFTIFLFRKEVGGYLFISNEPSMTFPNELEVEGCLGLNYHRVLPDTILNRTARWVLNSNDLVKFSVLTTELEEQLNNLTMAGATFVTEDELLQAKSNGVFPDKCVWVSFDDIDTTVFEYAFPILEEAKVPFTMFVIAGQVGNENFNNLRMATWEDLQEMQESGLASFGSHTYDMHRFENEVPVFLLSEHREDFKEDLTYSIQTIESKLGISVRSFAYSYGSTDDTTARIVKEQFEAGYILSPQTIRPQDDNFYLNRIVVNHTTFLEEILPFIEGQ